MPTILIELGIRFHFFTRDHEPVHIHIQTGDGRAKFELIPEIRLVYHYGVKPKDLKNAENIIKERKEMFIQAWRNVFGGE